MGTLPPRYFDQWETRVRNLALMRMSAGDSVLEIGGSDRPIVSAQDRPMGVRYVGLDPDDAVRDGAYEETIVASAERRCTALVARFDVVVSNDTLEHVPDVTLAVENIHDYLRPGGYFIALFAARWSPFAITARMLPHTVRVALLQRALGLDPTHHFPVHYDQCSYRALSRLFRGWCDLSIVPLYCGARYLAFSEPLQRAYLGYEHWAMTRPNLATHYLLAAQRRMS